MSDKNLDIYDLDQIVYYQNKYYERLINHPTNEKYRVMKSLKTDDYDYVTNKNLILTLDALFRND